MQFIMKIGIIGAGIVGRKRGMAVRDIGKDKVLFVADLDIRRAESLAVDFTGCRGTRDWREIVSDIDVDAICVSTTHNCLAEISLTALKHGKHVLCEKPLGVSAVEVAKCVGEAEKKRLIYKAGFNHRFHPGVSKAYTMFKGGRIGKLMYIKTTYGTGGRPGYEKEWRMDKKLSGGGELIDQGVHLIDLSRWFMGEITESKSELLTSFWPVKVEDNAFVWLKNKNVLAELHASWTEWKNRFVFEVYGTKGYLKIEGLGGSYGAETLTWGVRIPGAAPREKSWEFSGEDKSWVKEWVNFRQAIMGRIKLNGSGKDGLMVLGLVE